MTRKEARAVVGALALLEPRGSSVELLEADREYLLEQQLTALSPLLGETLETLLVWADVARMT